MRKFGLEFRERPLLTIRGHPQECELIVNDPDRFLQGPGVYYSVDHVRSRAPRRKFVNFVGELLVLIGVRPEPEICKHLA